MGYREVLCLADYGHVRIHTLVNYRDQQYLSGNDRIIKHVIQFADLSLTRFELEGDLSERVPILHFVLLNPAEHIRARSHGQPMVRQVRGQQTCPSSII